MTFPRAFRFPQARTRTIALALLLIAVGAGLLLIVHDRRATAALVQADPERILGDPALRSVALAAGRKVYDQHCASCHGTGGKGDRTIGAPDLTDDDHLYGTGKVIEIEAIARYGIRAFDKRGWNLAVMPAYARAVPDAAEPLPPQTPAQIEDLTQMLLAFTGRATDDTAARRGRDAYVAAGCWDCHGRDAGGDASIGAPSLTDDVWLYGGSADTIRQTLRRGRAGVSPAFVHRLSAVQLRAVAAYVASLAPPQRNMR